MYRGPGPRAVRRTSKSFSIHQGIMTEFRTFERPQLIDFCCCTLSLRSMTHTRRNGWGRKLPMPSLTDDRRRKTPQRIWHDNLAASNPYVLNCYRALMQIIDGCDMETAARGTQHSAASVVCRIIGTFVVPSFIPFDLIYTESQGSL
jgi:hypothetical protein